LKAKKGRLFRFLKWGFLSLLALVLVLVFLVAPYWLARFVTTFGTRPMDLELTTTPADLEVEFENVSFQSADGIPLKGWYLGGGNRGGSVACGHGLFRSRREVMERCVFLRKAGFNVLLFDFRRHGESEGDITTLGFKERLDMEGAVAFLRDRASGDRVFLLGVSMGAAAALLAAAETPEVSAVVADSSFLSFEHTVVHHLDLIFGLPRFPLGDEIVYFIERRAGFWREDFDLEKAVARIGDRPLLIIAGSDDRRMPVELQKRLYRGARGPSNQFIVIDGATHGAAYREDPETYQRVVLSFLEGVMDGPRATEG
jgi:pimeloyl-ACP methyl ester carboxylesterase